ncbi:type II secretion system protein [Urbifossiella limnaea]|uniref:Prepilin-type N-terminal cleavage/methylation domain-containing protein n=1 Tax=Urbifossiella limnaea TaxID=2528023 RepID=A0A517Y017_9BACT|nr:type II secretion system protein [Urbifossiella limnaea]QDU23109.1 hypothetical protein ETAA1_51000 [Urbifossiella limnaea]
MGRRTGRRAGFTLLEMVVVMWGMGVAMAVGGFVLVTAFRATKLGEAADTRTAYRAELGRVFRADVARAEAAPEMHNDLSAGADRLFLRLPGGAVVTYEWTDEGLFRAEGQSRMPLPLGSAQERVEFPRPANGVATLRLVQTIPGGVVRTAEVSAALGGDAR